MIKGSIVALITPMFDNGEIDYEAFRRLIDFHIEQESDALVVVGTSGESTTVTFNEQHELIRIAVEQSAGKIPIIAGSGSNSTHEAIELASFAKKNGAVAHLSVAPYYNKPGQEGLYQHFKAIAEAVDLPMILYNVPGRTVADIQNDTVLRLSQIDHIVGIKDATGNISRATDLIARAPKNFALYSGDDPTTLAFILLGGHGAITVTGNVAPKLMHQMCQAALNGEIACARELNDRLLPLHFKLFCESNPIPTKWALYKLGLIDQGIRLPLTRLSQSNQEVVLRAMQQVGMLI